MKAESIEPPNRKFHFAVFLLFIGRGVKMAGSSSHFNGI